VLVKGVQREKKREGLAGAAITQGSATYKKRFFSVQKDMLTRYPAAPTQPRISQNEYQTGTAVR